MVSRLTGGHSGSVLCVDVSPVTLTVASGSDTGELCLWSGAGELLQKYTRPDTECTSVLFSREKAECLYAAFGKEVLILDCTQLQSPVFTLVSNQDEVSQLALDDKEQFLAACDEGGEIKVYGLQDRKVFKTLRFLHTNMCSSVVFRTKQRPWELLSAGLDCRLVHWNFSKPQGLNQFNMQELHGMTCDTSGYLLNPPFIHHLTRNREGTVTAAALENGLVAVFDSSAKHLKETMCLKAHQQGAAQVCFTVGSFMLTAGNDAKIILWDLSKAEPHLGQANGMVNGNSTANAHNNNNDDDYGNDDIDQHNTTVTEACRVSVIVHSDKINWLAPFQKGGGGGEGEENSAWFVVVADNSSNLTVYPLDIPT